MDTLPRRGIEDSMYPKPAEVNKPSPTATRSMTMTLRVEYEPARLTPDEVVCAVLDRAAPANAPDIDAIGWEVTAGHAWGGDIRFRA